MNQLISDDTWLPILMTQHFLNNNIDINLMLQHCLSIHIIHVIEIKFCLFGITKPYRLVVFIKVL